VAVVPFGTLPKFREAGVIVSCPGVVAAVPVPTRGMASAGPGINRPPPVRPADFGAKVTFTVTLCPRARVKGNASALVLIENSPPTVCNGHSVRAQGRAFVSTIGRVDLAPIATCPNDSAEGLAVTDSLFTPVPPTSSTSIAFDALLENLIVLPVHLSEVGVKLILTSALCPAGKASGKFKPIAANSVLLTAVAEIVTLVFPVFVNVTSMVSVWPRTTAPNSICVRVHTSCCAAASTLAGTVQKIARAKPIIRRWMVGTTRERILDWGSRMPYSLNSSH